jgi:plasmid stabilization system protein ParE
VIRIALAPKTLDDFDRIIDHLIAREVSDAGARVAAIVSALDVLAEHPLIGRPVELGLRELVIGRDSRGYVALYRYEPAAELVRVLAVRAQREAGWGAGLADEA